MEVDFKEFIKAVDAYADTTGKSFATSLNRSMGGLLYKSRDSLFKRTPKTTKTKIKAGFRGKKGTAKLAKITVSKMRKAGKPITRASIADGMKDEMSRRYRGIGYIRAGWVIAAREFGANRLASPHAGGTAAKGKGKAATKKDLEAFALNAVGAELKSGEIRRKTYAQVQVAVDSKTKDMLGYIERKLAKANKRHGGK